MFLLKRLFKIVIFFSLFSVGFSLPVIDSIVVEKEKRLMSVYKKGCLIKTYKIALGGSPVGPKEQEGDQKTPEGSYKISYKNPKSMFHLSLRISYPNSFDKKRAAARGVKPGGDIMIHGLGKDFAHLGKLHTLYDWTLGCVAVTNEEIEEIYAASFVGAKIEIKP